MDNLLELGSEKAAYFEQKHGMKTHSAVKEALPHLSLPCKVLDLGCGQGRNALLLAGLGFDVTAVDGNQGALYSLDNIASQEQLPIRIGTYDINAAALDQVYDFILATVVFMFLDPGRIPDIIKNMQENTSAGGLNLIVSAMSTPDCPCPVAFPFTFGENELRGYYQDWQILEYKEELGSMHAKDENGNPIRFLFVTMLARKP